MKILRFVVFVQLLLCSIVAAGQTILYEEDFNSYTDGTVTGAGGKWSLDPSNYNPSGSRFFAVKNNRFEATGVWITCRLETETIDISAYAGVSASIQLPISSGSFEFDDFCELLYSINGGGWVSAETHHGNVTTAKTLSFSGVSGNTLRIQLRVRNSQTTERYFFDNLVVEGWAMNPALWLRADRGTDSTTDNAQVHSWEDQVGSHNATSGVASPSNNWHIMTPPRYRESIKNFNPAIEFNGTNTSMRLPRPAEDDFTFVVLMNAHSQGPSGSQWYQGAGIFDGEKNGTQYDFGGITLLQDKIAFGTGLSDNTVRATQAVSLNIPYMVVATRQRSNGRKNLYLNGVHNGTSTGTTGSLDDVNSLVFGSLYSNNRFFDGYIHEVQVYKRVITANEMLNLEGYFALKYGLTLSKNYLIEDETVYDIAGYGSDIAGLGCNEGFGLDQRIASSSNLVTNVSGRVVMSTSNDFESPNPTTARPQIQDKHYLVWGHNNASTSSWQKQGDYKRIARMWKVQNTRDVGSVHFQINLSNFIYPQDKFYLIVDSDNDLSNGITSSYELTQGVGDLFTCEVDFPNGVSYFTIGFKEEKYRALWLRADAGTNSKLDGAVIGSWNDQSVKGNNATQTDANRRAILRNDGINFNPILEFDGNNDFYDLEAKNGLGYGDTKRSTFLVARDDQTNANAWIFAFAYGDNSTRESWGLGRDKLSTTQYAYAVSTYGSNILFGDWKTKPRLLEGVYDNPATKMIVDGRQLLQDNFVINTNNTKAHIGRQIDLENKYWGGAIAEVIHYVGELTDEERSEIQSYLAMKYGIALKKNYTVGAHTLYDVSVYLKDVTALGRNDAFGFDQRVSSSVNRSVTTAGNFTLSTTNDFTSNNSTGRTQLEDGDYILCGRNVKGINSWKTSGTYKRVDRTWRVENTGVTHDVFLQFNLATVPTTATSYYLIFDSDEDISNGVLGESEFTHDGGTLYSTSVTFPEGVSYFTIGYNLSLDIDLVSFSNIDCPGDTDGAIEVTGVDGIGTYTYSWSSGENSAAITGKGKGTYTVTVTSGGLTANKTFHIYDPDIAVVTHSINDVGCPNDDDGAINLSVAEPDDYSIVLDGVNDYVALNHSFNGVNALPEMTACAWIKVEPGRGGASIIDYDSSEYFRISVGGATRADNFVHFDTRSQLNGSTHSLVGGVNVRDNNWHHIACVYDGKDAFIYVDGVLDVTAESPHGDRAIGSTVTRFGFIGTQSEATWVNGAKNATYFSGKVASVEFWERGLSLQEVASRMYASEDGADLVKSWRIEENTGTVTNAESGESHQMYGGVVWSTDDYYSTPTYQWTKTGDTFMSTTEDINSLTLGTYKVVVGLQNGCEVTSDYEVEAEHQNIDTNIIQAE